VKLASCHFLIYILFLFLPHPTLKVIPTHFQFLFPNEKRAGQIIYQKTDAPLFIEQRAFSSALTKKIEPLQWAAIPLLTNKTNTFVHIKNKPSGLYFKTMEWGYQSIKITYPYKVENIRLPTSVKEMIDGTSEDQILSEKKLNYEILSQVTETRLPHCWTAPITSTSASGFAKPRYLENGHFYYHTGTDLRAPSNTPIKAASDGIVAFAKHQTIPGNMIVIDHGQGVFSRYMHLKQFLVNVGDKVSQGQVIGKSGSTGRSTGPHLHWEIVWKESFVDAFDFLQFSEEICDQG